MGYSSMKWRNGMTTLATKNYSAKDLCLIIKACNEGQVSKLELEGIKIDFLTKEGLSTNNIDERNSIEKLDRYHSPIEEQIQNKITEIEQAEAEDFFQMNNPLGFEESLINNRERDIQEC